MSKPRYDVFTSNAPVEPDEDDWQIFAEGVTKWALRRVMKQLYRDGWDRVSILVVRKAKPRCPACQAELE